MQHRLCVLSNNLKRKFGENMEMTDNLKQNLYTKQKLKFNSDGNFKIVMMSDLQETLDFDERTMSGIKAILDSEKPDLVVLGGDN